MKAECALRDHPAYGRWVRQQPSGRLVIDRAKVAAEERLDGKYLLSTSDPDLSVEDIALGYKNLLEISYRGDPRRINEPSRDPRPAIPPIPPAEPGALPDPQYRQPPAPGGYVPPQA